MTTTAVLVTDEDGTQWLCGSFRTDDKAERIAEAIRADTGSETRVLPLQVYP